MCVISADCPAGQHCDLGECAQDCNTKDPCTGELTCSPRARCLPPAAPDIDPPPVSKQLGEISVETPAITLTEKDSSFTINLKSTAPDTVRYRVVLSGPHLSIDEPRGSFIGHGQITIGVSSRALQGRDVPGVIKVFTTLGDVIVQAPMHVGLTGSYHGALRYDGGLVPLGDARIALELIEKQGDVIARVNSTRSLLFPSSDPHDTSNAHDTTGQGSFTASAGLDLTLNQVIDGSFGGTRNHFARPIGRRIHLALMPSSTGDLQGTLDEQIVGLFTQPVVVRGTAWLQYDPGAGDPKFEMQPPAAMPSATNAAWSTPDTVFGWDNYDCASIVCGGACNDVLGAIQATESTYYAALTVAIAGRFKTSRPLANIASSCTEALGAKSLADYAGEATGCALVPPIACAMKIAGVAPNTIENGKAFARTVAETLAPALLVAKNDLVAGLSASFVSGLSTESGHYEQALSLLGPSARWVLQPAALETLRHLPAAAARGDSPALGDSATEHQPFASARALADLFHTLAVLDGERARVNAALRTDDGAARAQESGVLTFLESATLLSIFENWAVAPPVATATLTGVLSPIDQAYGALLQGADAFGVPRGFVPFAYRPEQAASAPTNFEQMLAIASAAVTHEAELETAFKANKREYEQDQHALSVELAGVRSQFDAKLAQLCGTSFDPDKVTAPSDWEKCGANGEGDLGDLVNQVDQAKAHLRSAQSRIAGMRDKIAIDQHSLAQTQHVHEQTLSFIQSNGEALSAITLSEAVISAEEKFIDVAAQASIGNAGAPVGEAAVSAILELEKGGLEVQKQQLQTAQQMRFEQAAAQSELINGMANIQKETIDLAQLGVDMQSDAIALTGAQLRGRNLVLQAKAIWEERGRALTLVNQNPANDPTFRILRDQQAEQLLEARSDAARQLYLAGLALQYEVNTSITPIGPAALRASNNLGLSGLQDCMRRIFSDWRMAFGNPQDEPRTVSVRKMLGILETRTDEVTGQVLSEGDQFRQLLLRNENLDGKGGVGIQFATNLQPGNGLWATDVCTDRIVSVQAQLVGDYLGDNEATVEISLSGGGELRACGSDELTPWTFGSTGSLAADGFAAVHAGVNSFGDGPPNTSLFGQPVARASWKVVIPGGNEAPANSDIDLTKIEDIVLKIYHRALPQRSSGAGLNLSCLGG